MAESTTTNGWKIVASGSGVILGESPVYSSTNECLYWIDIDGKRIHRSRQHHQESPSYSTDTIQLDCIPGTIGLVEHQPNWIWIGTNRGVRILDWSTLQSWQIAPFPEDSKLFRFNDGKVDPNGDLVISTMITESDAKKRAGKGKLWRFRLPRTENEAISMIPLVDGATIPNGLDWYPSHPPSLPQLYWVETTKKVIERVEFQAVPNSELKVIERHLAFSCVNRPSPIAGEPDGMVLDHEGNFWIAMPGGSQICRFTPSGELLQSIRLPVSKVTSLCFGGDQFQDLFITSASKGINRAKEPLAGSVFVIQNIGPRGKEMNPLKGASQSISNQRDLIQHQFLASIPPTPQPRLISKL